MVFKVFFQFLQLLIVMFSFVPIARKPPKISKDIDVIGKPDYLISAKANPLCKLQTLHISEPDQYAAKKIPLLENSNCFTSVSTGPSSSYATTISLTSQITIFPFAYPTAIMRPSGWNFSELTLDGSLRIKSYFYPLQSCILHCPSEELTATMPSSGVKHTSEICYA